MAARRLTLCTLAVAAAAAGAHAGGTAPTNLGIPGGNGEASGHRLATPVREFSANADLNGDGDLFDTVVHVHDGNSGATTNLGLASFAVAHDGRTFAFGVGERGQGNQDLNGDGDTMDQILFVHDAVTGTTRNTGIAFSGFPRVAGHHVAVEANERGNGQTDLNGDGDYFDLVLETVDARTGKITNHAISAGGIRNDGQYLWFNASEISQGYTDLNGDGDTWDSIVHVLDGNTGKILNTRLSGIVDGVSSGALAMRVFESSEGKDLNGDGDLSDHVVGLVELSNGAVTNLGVGAYGVVLSDQLIAIAAAEFQEGVDLNGDGDLGDLVLQVVDRGSLSRTNLGVAANTFGTVVDGKRVAFSVYEYNQGASDLNGDGDFFDPVVHVYDGATGSLQNLGLAGGIGGFSDHRVFFAVPEMSQGGTDLNGDGDTFDAVLFAHDFAGNKTANLGIAAGGIATGHGVVGFGVREAQQGGTDLNGDGDTFDTVVHLLDPRTDVITNTCLAGNGISIANPTRQLIAFNVTELSQGQDLNGDGDLFDAILHTTSLPAN